MTSTYSTEGLTSPQRRCLAQLPESVRADWVDLCRNPRWTVERTEPDTQTRQAGWAIVSADEPPGGTWSPSALELIEIMRGW